MANLLTEVPLNIWIKAGWQDYLEVIEHSPYPKAKYYYHNQELRVEMSPIGSDHSRDHGIILIAVSLFAGIKNIPCTVRDNCSYRKTGSQEAQPDVSYSIGDHADLIPWGTSVIDLDIYPPPDLVIEVAHSSLTDDQEKKGCFMRIYKLRNIGLWMCRMFK